MNKTNLKYYFKESGILLTHPCVTCSSTPTMYMIIRSGLGGFMSAQLKHSGDKIIMYMNNDLYYRNICPQDIFHHVVCTVYIHSTIKH